MASKALILLFIFKTFKNFFFGKRLITIKEHQKHKKKQKQIDYFPGISLLIFNAKCQFWQSQPFSNQIRKLLCESSTNNLHLCWRRLLESKS